LVLEEFKKNEVLVNKILLLWGVVSLVSLHFGFIKPAAFMLAGGINRLILDIPEIKIFLDEVLKDRETLANHWLDTNLSEVRWFTYFTNLFLIVGYADLFFLQEVSATEPEVWEAKAFMLDFILISSRILIIGINAQIIFYRNVKTKWELVSLVVSTTVVTGTIYVTNAICDGLSNASKHSYISTAFSTYMYGYCAATKADADLDNVLKAIPGYNSQAHLIPGTKNLDHSKLVSTMVSNKPYFDQEAMVAEMVKNNADLGAYRKPKDS
jgi:hypothetical protein